MNFKDTVIEYQKGDADFIIMANKQFPFLVEAITKIGFKGIEDSKYSVTGVKSKIIRLSTGSDKQKIFQHLKNSSYIYEGGFVELKTLKNLFTKIYTDLDIKITPKAIDIQTYYHTKDYTKRIKTVEIKDGAEKTVWQSKTGYVISKAKL